jgi:hypothetical protein
MFKADLLQKTLKNLEELSLDNLTNVDRKKRISTLELAILNCEGSDVVDEEGHITDKDILDRVNVIRKALTLIPIQRPFRWWYWIDIVFRFCGVCCGFFTISILSLPIILLQIIDDIIKMNPYHRLSEYMRAFVAQYMLVLAGVVYDVYDLDKKAFNAPCVIFAFTHACNLDGLLISSKSYFCLCLFLFLFSCSFLLILVVYPEDIAFSILFPTNVTSPHIT